MSLSISYDEPCMRHIRSTSAVASSSVPTCTRSLKTLSSSPSDILGQHATHVQLVVVSKVKTNSTLYQASQQGGGECPRLRQWQQTNGSGRCTETVSKIAKCGVGRSVNRRRWQAAPITEPGLSFRENAGLSRPASSENHKIERVSCKGRAEALARVRSHIRRSGRAEAGSRRSRRREKWALAERMDDCHWIPPKIGSHVQSRKTPRAESLSGGP